MEYYLNKNNKFHNYLYWKIHKYIYSIHWYNKVIVSFCHNSSLGLATKAKGLVRLKAKRKPGSHTTWSRECRKVWENEPSNSQGNSHFGRWSPSEFLNLQNAIAVVKTHWLEEFFISSESSKTWTSKTQIMAKRKVRIQIDSLIPNH